LAGVARDDPERVPRRKRWIRRLRELNPTIAAVQSGGASPTRWFR
jgi:hypothetical protein